MSFKTKSFTFLVISILLHVLLVWFLISSQLPTKKQDSTSTTIHSYIKFQNSSSPKSDVVSNHALESTNELLSKRLTTIEPSAANIALPVNNNHVLKPRDVAVTEQSNQPAGTVVKDNKRLTKIGDFTSQYIQNVDKKALDILSGSAKDEFRAPKPIVDKSSASPSKRIQQKLDESFAPLGMDITVLSQTAGETLLMHGDSCYRVRETALDDKVGRGASLWSRSSGCRKNAPFDGQLQISLDKYLNK